MSYYVYILAKAKHSTFYTGLTNNLVRRIYEHKHEMVDGFTKKYGIKTLVYYEVHRDIHEAIRREKSIKRWTRKKKVIAIEEMNLSWCDLYQKIIQG